MKKTEEEKRKKYYTKGQLFKHLSGISQPYRIHSSVKSPAWCPDTYSLSVHMNVSKLQETVKDREAWHAAVDGVAKRWA